MPRVAERPPAEAEEGERGEARDVWRSFAKRKRSKQEKIDCSSAEPRIAGSQKRGTYLEYTHPPARVPARPHVNGGVIWYLGPPGQVTGPEDWRNWPGGAALQRLHLHAARCWFLIAERSGTGRPDHAYCPLGSSGQLLFGNIVARACQDM